MDVVNVPEKAYIYGLFDPRCPDVIWYVGKTNNQRTRLQYYRKDKSTTPVYKWFRRLQAEGSEPQLKVLEVCPFSEWKEREIAAIVLHRKKNLLLLNKLDGGNGTSVKGRKELCECGAKRIRLYPSDIALRCPICRPSQRKVYEKNWNLENKEHVKIFKHRKYVANQTTHTARTVKRRERLHKEGLCVRCGGGQAVSRRTMCETCLGRSAQLQRLYRTKAESQSFEISFC